MKLYQIVEIAGSGNHAGTKATADIAEIAEQMGFMPVRIQMRSTALSKMAKIQRQIGYLKDWHQAWRCIEKESIVLLQHPFHYKIFRLRYKTEDKMVLEHLTLLTIHSL